MKLKNNIMEEWKDIIGYEGIYKISNTGKIKSLSREFVRSNNRNFITKEKILINGLNSRGYVSITLYNKDKVKKKLLVHRLVAEAFIENKENNPVINHINGIKTNNNASNLEWCTQGYNLNHALKNKLRINLKGENHCLAKLNNEDVLNIVKLINTGMTNQLISELYNVKFSTISSIKMGRTWNHLTNIKTYEIEE